MTSLTLCGLQEPYGMDEAKSSRRFSSSCETGKNHLAVQPNVSVDEVSWKVKRVLSLLIISAQPKSSPSRHWTPIPVPAVPARSLSTCTCTRESLNTPTSPLVERNKHNSI
jgi:hypothetical protein